MGTTTCRDLFRVKEMRKETVNMGKTGENEGKQRENKERFGEEQKKTGSVGTSL